MLHQGKILKRQIEKKNISQIEAAQMLNLSRSGLTGLFDKVVLPEKHIDKAVEAFGLKREIFFPQSDTQHATTGEDAHCWRQLAEARQEIIDLQKQVIALSLPHINAPKKVQQPA